MYNSDNEDMEGLGAYTDAVMRYELLRQTHTSAYFSLDEFREILDYYQFSYHGKDVNVQILGVLDDAINLHPNSLDFYFEKVDILISLTWYGQAMNLLTQLAQTCGDIDVACKQAEVLLCQGYGVEAVRMFDSLLVHTQDSSEKRRILYTATYAFIHIGDLRQAISYQQQYAKIAEGTSAWEMLAQLYFENEDFEMAVQTMLYAVQLNHGAVLTSTWLNLAQYYSYNNQDEEALDVIDNALKSSSLEDYEEQLLLCEKSDILIDLERTDEALVLIDAYFSTNKIEDSPELFYQKAYSYSCLEDTIMAEQAYEQLINIYGVAPLDSPLSITPYLQALVGLSTLCLVTGRYEKAKECIEACLAIVPNYVDALLLKAKMQIESLAFSEAEQLLRAVIEQDEKCVEARLLLANCKVLQNETPLAVKILQRGLQKNRNSHEILYRLAHIFYIQKRMTTCLFYLAQAFEKDVLAADEFFDLNPDAESNFEVKQLYAKYTTT
ncbi:MAG: tetratricopeptide repeat protein [Bacteroidales bacterium]